MTDEFSIDLIGSFIPSHSFHLLFYNGTKRKHEKSKGRRIPIIIENVHRKKTKGKMKISGKSPIF